jgi:predicted DNA-binding antitoxin AbrB/MazE fold protein
VKDKVDLKEGMTVEVVEMIAELAAVEIEEVAVAETVVAKVEDEDNRQFKICDFRFY